MEKLLSCHKKIFYFQHMKRQRSLFFQVSVFVLAQVAWLSLLGLWIYRFISSQLILEQVGDQLSSQIMNKTTDVFTLVSGCILFVAVSVSMSLLFRYLTVQHKLTQLYDNFIANVTHELKSPLSSIQLYLETLNARKVPTLKQKEFISMMIKDTVRLKHSINTILEIAGLEQKKVLYQCQVYKAELIIRTIIEEVRDHFNLPNEAIRVEGEAPCECVIEKNAFIILMNNLVDNAIKYSMGPVEIRVKMRCTLKRIVLEFFDTGIGIAPKEQKKIFHKFHRVYHPDIPNVKGTGLGLYWVKEIVKYHGGKISVVSQGNNRGTMFRIELPVYRIAKKRYLDNLLKIAKKRKIAGIRS